LEKGNLSIIKREISSFKRNDVFKNQKVPLTNAIKQINLENKLNLFLIEHVFNQTKKISKAYFNKPRQLFSNSVNDDTNDLNSLITSFYQVKKGFIDFLE